ncbi:MAG: hypothetical protein EOP38_15435 [Rubrivivax sp.]|nr:MAG: hypothetical protein EOP38_15435 [Rubrivivax sp.]
MTPENEAHMQLTINKLRADLIATNNAVHALLGALDATQRVEALKLFAQLHELQEQTVAQAPRPASPQATKRMREAHERMYTSLQSVHTMARPAG